MSAEASKDDHPGNSLVSIKINGPTYEIHRGRQSVGDIKKLGGVHPADILAQLIDGKFVDLPDDGHVTIKGGEEFQSHPRDSGSSHQ
jgi:hypothetical protein